MATCNFSALNGTIFAYAMAYEDDETKETVYPDGWEVEEFEDTILYELQDIDFQPDTNNRIYVNGDYFPCLAYKSISKDFGGMEFCIDIQVFTRSGYYEGKNVDYKLRCYWYNGWENEVDLDADVTDFIYDLKQNDIFNAGLCTILGRKIFRWLNDMAVTETERLDKTLAKVTETYKKVATFSNGEAVYEKIDIL